MGLYNSFPHHLDVLFSYLMQLQVPEAGMIPKQENVTISLNLYVRIPGGLVGQVAPTPYLAKLGCQ